MRFRTSFALSAGLVLAGTVQATAVPATTTANTNVRSGPGARFGVIASLPAGAQVDIMSCTGNWCQTQYGYVSARLLNQGGYGVAQPGIARAYAPANYAATSPGTNYRQPVGIQQMAQQPFLPAQATTMPSTVPSAGTNYRQPVGTTAPAPAAGGVAMPGYDAQAGVALGAALVTPGGTVTGAPGSFGTMRGARTTIGETNVRSGPGVDYSIVKTLPDFTKVEVQSCANQWCQTDEGYISLFHLSRGPVQQVLSSGAQPLLPGSGSRDSAYYAGNLSAQATMGYGAAGQGVAGQGVLGQGMVAGVAAPYAASNTNYRVPLAQQQGVIQPGIAQAPYAQQRPMVQPVAAGRAYAPANYGATPYGAAGGQVMGGQATTRSNVNVRSGPGARFGVIASLPAGAQVDIMSCTGNWCQTQYGYVSARLLNQGGYGAAQPGIARAYAPANYAATSPGTNYRQPVNALPTQARPFLPAQATTVPSTVPSAGTNYRQPVGTNAPAAPIAPANAAYQATAYQDPRRFAPTAGAQGQGYSATTISALNVRSGPGVGYEVLGTLPAGSTVNVASCSGSWCQTEYGYVSARHLSTGGNVAPSVRYETPRAAPATRNVAYAAPAYATQSYGAPSYASQPYGGQAYGGQAYAANATFGEAYAGSRYIPGATYPTYNTPSLGNLIADVAAPFEALAAVATYGFGEGGWGGGWYNAPAVAPSSANWRASLGPRYSYGTRDVGPGYWGPALYGRNIPSNWGARPSYWGGRPTYWNMHPGYPTRAYRGDKRGNMYWSRRDEGRRPQAASWYGGGSYGLGPRGQGPYDAGPSYNGRPVVWRPRSGLF